MSIVADIVVAIHVAYMAFVVFGFIAVPLGVAAQPVVPLAARSGDSVCRR